MVANAERRDVTLDVREKSINRGEKPAARDENATESYQCSHINLTMTGVSHTP